MENIKDVLTKKLEGFKNQLEMSENVIVSHNWVMVVNDVFTVALDEEGKTFATTKAFPSQFSENAAKEIENCTFRNHKNEVMMPRKVFYKDYYKRKIKELEETIQTLR